MAAFWHRRQLAAGRSFARRSQRPAAAAPQVLRGRLQLPAPGRLVLAVQAGAAGLCLCGRHVPPSARACRAHAAHGALPR
jgi:hypothetical protein